MTGGGNGHSVFSGGGVCDGGRGLDIQFLAVVVSLMGEGTGHSVFSGRGVYDGGRGLDIQFLAVEVSVTGAGDWIFSF